MAYSHHNQRSCVGVCCNMAHTNGTNGSLLSPQPTLVRRRVVVLHTCACCVPNQAKQKTRRASWERSSRRTGMTNRERPQRPQRLKSKKDLSTQTSERVPHIRTICARRGLTSLCGREVVRSSGYGRDKMKGRVTTSKPRWEFL